MALWWGEELAARLGSMLVLVLFGGLGLAKASRIVPEAPSLARHGVSTFGLLPMSGRPLSSLHRAEGIDVFDLSPLPKPGVSSFGFQPVSGRPFSSLHMMAGGTGVPEASSLGGPGGSSFGLQPMSGRPLSRLHERKGVPDPRGVLKGQPRRPSNLSGALPTEAEPGTTVKMDLQRISNRHGAPVESWRVGTERIPTVVKEIKIRTEDDFFATTNELRAILKMRGRGVFPTVYDMWYRKSDETLMEIVIMSEDHSGTLRDVLAQYHDRLDVTSALDLFVSIADELQRLVLSGIAHDSPTAKEILIVGDTRYLSRCRVVLCPSLTNTNIRVKNPGAALRRFLTFRGRQDPRAEMRSKAEVERADLISMGRLLNEIVAAMSDRDAERYFDFADGVLDELKQQEFGNIVSRTKTIRQAWLIEHPPLYQPRLIANPLELDGTDDDAVSSADDFKAPDNLAPIIQANLREASRFMRRRPRGGDIYEDLAPIEKQVFVEDDKKLRDDVFNEIINAYLD